MATFNFLNDLFGRRDIFLGAACVSSTNLSILQSVGYNHYTVTYRCIQNDDCNLYELLRAVYNYKKNEQTRHMHDWT